MCKRKETDKNAVQMRKYWMFKGRDCTDL